MTISRGDRAISAATTAVLALLSMLVLYGCSGEKTDSTIDAKDVTGLGVISIKALDDLANPYRGHYGEWDEWVYGNIVVEPLAYEDGVRPKDLKVLKARVTGDGYLLPQLEKARAVHEQMKLGYDDDHYSVKRIAPYSVQAAGVMSAEMSKALHTAIGRVQAKYYLPVPKWVADEPPLYALLVPNGDVVAYGPRGSGIEGSELINPCCGGGQASYYRYSHDGELIRTAAHSWWFLYFDDVAHERPAGSMKNRHDGYVYFTDLEADEITSVWDWDGIEVEVPVLPPARDIHPFVSLKPAQLRNIYEGQS